MVNYKSFRLNKINTPEFEHVKLLLFWPFFGLAFLTLERFLKLDYDSVLRILCYTVLFLVCVPYRNVGVFVFLRCSDI